MDLEVQQDLSMESSNNKNDVPKHVSPYLTSVTEVSETASLSIAGFYATESRILHIIGDIAIAALGGKTEIIDISELPTNITKLSNIESVKAYNPSFVINGTFFSFDRKSFKGNAINIDNPQNPTVVENFSFLRDEMKPYSDRFNYIQDYKIADEQVYLLWNNGVVDVYHLEGRKLIFDKSNWESPDSFFHRTPITMTVHNGLPYVVESYNTSIYTPFAQDYFHSYWLGKDLAHLINGRSELIADSDVLYLTSRFGIAILNPEALPSYSPSNYILSVFDCHCEYIYIHEKKGFKSSLFRPKMTVMDFSNPLLPMESKLVIDTTQNEWDFDGFDYDILVSNNRLLIRTVKEYEDYYSPNGYMIFNLL